MFHTASGPTTDDTNVTTTYLAVKPLQWLGVIPYMAVMTPTPVLVQRRCGVIFLPSCFPQPVTCKTRLYKHLRSLTNPCCSSSFLILIILPSVYVQGHD